MYFDQKLVLSPAECIVQEVEEAVPLCRRAELAEWLTELAGKLHVLQSTT